MLVLLAEANGSPAAKHVRPWDRIATRCLAARLDRELAAGVAPDSSAARALRAQQLTRPSARRDLAESVERALTIGMRPAAARSPAVPVCRDKVSEAAGELRELVGCLVAPGPVRARGVALVRILLSDGGGPLYRGNTQATCRRGLARHPKRCAGCGELRSGCGAAGVRPTLRLLRDPVIQGTRPD